MKILISTSLILAIISSFSVARCYAELKTGEMTADEKINYAIGAEVIRNYLSRGIKLQVEPLIRGVTDAATGQKLILSEKEIRSILVSVQSDLRKQQAMEKKRSEQTKFILKHYTSVSK